MKTILSFFLLIVLLAGCAKTDHFPEPAAADLTGIWVNPEYTDSTISFQRASAFTKNEYGLHFRSENQLTERKNEGWCGTPPIVTADYEGLWTMSDSTLQIHVPYWGGMAEYNWKLISVSSDHLMIRVLSNVYETGK
jgi:hypothetical protein